jgi:hypothetical protein
MTSVPSSSCEVQEDFSRIEDVPDMEEVSVDAMDFLSLQRNALPLLIHLACNYQEIGLVQLRVLSISNCIIPT